MRDRENNSSFTSYKEICFLELRKYDGFSEACRVIVEKYVVVAIAVVVVVVVVHATDEAAFAD